MSLQLITAVGRKQMLAHSPRASSKSPLEKGEDSAGYDSEITQASAERPSFPSPPSELRGVVPGPSGPLTRPGRCRAGSPLSPGALSGAGLGVRLPPFRLWKGVSPPPAQRTCPCSSRCRKPTPTPALTSARTPRASRESRPRSAGAGAGPSAAPSKHPAPPHGLPLRPQRTSGQRWAGPVWVASRVEPAHFEVTFAQEQLDLACGVAGRKGWAARGGSLQRSSQHSEEHGPRSGARRSAGLPGLDSPHSDPAVSTWRSSGRMSQRGWVFLGCLWREGTR